MKNKSSQPFSHVHDLLRLKLTKCSNLPGPLKFLGKKPFPRSCCMKPRWRLGLLACGLVLRPSLWTRAMATAGDRAPKRRKGTFASGQTQQFAEATPLGRQ